MKTLSAKIAFLFFGIVALSGLISSPVALLLGFVFTLFFDHPLKAFNHKIIQYLLKISVVGLGFGMLITETLQTGRESFGLTFFSITLTVVLGIVGVRLLKLDRKLGHLITSGTAICGGSAIAAISPIINAPAKTISIALGIVFLLNSMALLVFPSIGHLLHLTQQQFGLWCAVAIHDTSSVVGAALSYGDEALRIATTVKLSRTLWIIPLSIFSMFLFKTKGEKINIPYFILLFMLAVVVNSYQLLPVFITETIVLVSKRLLILTLFLVGSSISVTDLKETGLRSISFAVLLWTSISLFSLAYITL